MPPIEVGRTEAIRAISTALARAENGQGLARAAEVASPKSAVAAAAATTVEAGAALDPGQPPVDVERVAQIRKAVETGTYPVVPAKIADAMIAAGMMLRNPKA